MEVAAVLVAIRGATSERRTVPCPEVRGIYLPRPVARVVQWVADTTHWGV